MTPVIWSPQSLHDLESIRAYIAEDSAAYAELVVRRIVAAVERIHAFPESGRMVPEREAPEIREVIVSPYRVVYRLRPQVVKLSRSFAVRGNFRNLFSSVGPTSEWSRRVRPSVRSCRCGARLVRRIGPTALHQLCGPGLNCLKLAAMSLLDRISIDSAVRFGKPCVRGTRITVGDILGYWLVARPRSSCSTSSRN